MRKSRDSVCVATNYGLDALEVGVHECRYGQEFSHLHSIQTVSVVHPTSCPIGTGGKAAGA
jgi:hypothetical protein